MLRLLFLLAGLVGSQDQRSTAESGLEHSRLVDGAAIVVHRQPDVSLVAIRMSLVAYDPAGFAGAGHMIQHLHYPSLQDRAARVGGRVQIQRTSDALVYTAIGPAAELAYLAQLLISTLEAPRPALDAVLRAERELREERLAEWETAPAHTRSVLRSQIFPGDVSGTGTDRAATRFSVTTLPDIWARMYHPERVSVVAVGGVFLADVETAFSALPPAPAVRPASIERDSLILTSLAPPQATRAWFGTAYLANDMPPAAVTVTTRLIGDHVRQVIPSAQVDAEHWWTHYGQALAFIVAVPEPETATARRVLGTSVASVLDDLDPEVVEAAATAVRREMLFYSRTPDRMADVVGQFIDREGDPNATERFYADLESVDEDDVRAILERLTERSPARVEIPPQTLLPPRRR